jgi:hypothetical protein
MNTQLKRFQSRLETIYSADLLNTAFRDCKDEAGYADQGDSYVCFIHDASNNTIENSTGNPIASYYNDDNSARVSDISSSFMPIHYKNLGSYDAVNETYTYTFGNVYAHLIGNSDKVGNYEDFKQDLSDVYHAMYTNSHFDDHHTNKMNEYMKTKKKRKDLDRKMREIYDEKNSDTYMMFDNSVYTNLAWTVLATSVLYYLFVKL